MARGGVEPPARRKKTERPREPSVPSGGVFRRSRPPSPPPRQPGANPFEKAETRPTACAALSETPPKASEASRPLAAAFNEPSADGAESPSGLPPAPGPRPKVKGGVEKQPLDIALFPPRARRRRWRGGRRYPFQRAGNPPLSPPTPRAQARSGSCSRPSRRGARRWGKPSRRAPCATRAPDRRDTSPTSPPTPPRSGRSQA